MCVIRYLVQLPERDSEGRRVIFSVAAKFDPYKYTSAQMARVHSIVVESLMDDEENQITGTDTIDFKSSSLRWVRFRGWIGDRDQRYEWESV